MPAASVTKSAISRAIAAWKESGLKVGGMEITKDGAIRITAAVDESEPGPQRGGPRQWPTR
ncbi:hypothetical protein D1114_16670 [Cereibacter sphaeroides]|uniref:Uncharacterized protein n=1 Tax=Cereibacter sphaeroides TaxID=1063 RepID=A0AAX1UHU4_CERSP|nr:hypothetical protein [Cereibacter sphaeroides]RHZ92835.1 hypothetical protein D1114_16670 [Cereibacter sphaeroides]